MRGLTILSVLLGVLQLSTSCPSLTQSGDTTWRLSFDTTNNIFYIEQVGENSGYYSFSGVDYDTMGLEVVFPGFPGHAIIEPSVTLAQMQGLSNIVVQGNRISTSEYTATYSLGAPISQINARSFTVTISQDFVFLGICSQADIVMQADCKDFSPKINVIKAGNTCNSYGGCYPCDCGCSSGNCYGPGAGMCCHSSCKTCHGPANTQCQSCAPGYYLQPSPNAYTCSTSCPVGFCANDTLAACIKCSNMQVWFNSSCLEACPYGYIQTTQVACGKCNDTSLIYYNHTCITSCPLKTYKAFNSVIGGYECLPCYIGCDTCETSDALSCTGCSEGFFYFNNTCNDGCPAAMHANKLERTCERCPAPCWTCSQPNTDSCTSCLPGYLLHSGTCILNCPENYYQGSYIGEVGVYEVPTCFPKLELVFNLSLTSEARAVNINFNYGVINMILAISEKIKIQIGNTEIDNVLFVLSVVSESKLRFQYLGDQYYPPLSLLNVTINLDSAEFNSNAYQRFRIVSKTATLQLKEIYPFTKVETQFISSSSALTGATGGTVATIQAVNSVTQGALCLSLLWLQIVGELVQIMKFIDIRWPPNVAQFYSTSHIDPSSIVMPIELTGAINDKLNNNYTIPRVFDEYEVSPFFMKNYNNELSNLALWVPIVVFGSLIIRLSKICLSKMAQPLNLPIKSSVKKNKNKKTSKIRESYFATINKLNELMIRVSDTRLWNFLMVFILSIYQSGNLWALFNIRYSTSLVEPSTIETRTSLAIGIIFFLCFLGLLAFITRTLLTNMKHLLQKEEHSRPPHLKKYELLFEDLNCQKRIQLFYLPISLLRVWINAVIVALMSFSPITQITLYWLTNSAFIIYLILCRPLKEKLMRRMTLIIEILAYGCVLFAVILAIVTRYVDIDVVTLDEAGFLFICLSIGSTLAGGILSLIQVLQLVRVLYLYVKDRMGKQKKVQSISLSETQLGSDNIS